ncbi:hypothetical protein [Natrarchaeobius oligotrophus]|uniref:Uncharacterized protein n=1 Tax=Natrarchaeobius chitinivorans TaxID=1679083 RepID=A0A3N6M6P8_NATCH|nr:hypothetical protein [Natrarchaeobius chitinivorans]RQG99258.1 hypothetical protein EA472_15365 [Natrarchaeobius chitinivorans]
MAHANVLPRFDECIDLYRLAYDRYGTEPFTLDHVDEELSVRNARELLDLAVAYGVLEFDGTTYRVRCEPDDPADAWRSALTTRAQRVQRSLVDRFVLEEDGDLEDRTPDSDVLTYDSNRFESVFVSESDDLDAIADAIVSRSSGSTAGVVLRSPGEDAGHVQWCADRLCDPSAVAETSLEEPLQKEYSDVAGDDKNDLEFRLFLRQP